MIPFEILRFFFTLKSPGVNERSVSQETAFQKSKKTSRLFSQHYRLKYFFCSNWKQFQVFKVAKFEYMQGNSTLWHMDEIHPVVTPLKVSFCFVLFCNKNESFLLHGTYLLCDIRQDNHWPASSWLKFR